MATRINSLLRFQRQQKGLGCFKDGFLYLNTMRFVKAYRQLLRPGSLRPFRLFLFWLQFRHVAVWKLFGISYRDVINSTHQGNRIGGVFLLLILILLCSKSKNGIKSKIKSKKEQTTFQYVSKLYSFLFVSFVFFVDALFLPTHHEERPRQDKLRTRTFFTGSNLSRWPGRLL
jgi:hypothetical protein